METKDVRSQLSETNLSPDPKASQKRLAEVREEISCYMDDILSLFKPGAKVTVLVRTPGNDNADMLLTSDTLDQVAAMVERAKRNPES